MRRIKLGKKDSSIGRITRNRILVVPGMTTTHGRKKERKHRNSSIGGVYFVSRRNCVAVVKNVPELSSVKNQGTNQKCSFVSVLGQ